VNFTIITQAVHTESDVMGTRQRARQLAALLGFDSQDQTRISTAVSEIVRNAFEYAGGGRVEYGIESRTDSQLFVIRVSDKGPGIQGSADKKSDGKAGGGSGLHGSRRLMDEFKVDSVIGQGTTVVLGKLLPALIKVDAVQVARIADELVRLHPQNTFEEVRQQNSELLSALDQIQEAQDLLEMRVKLRTAELDAANSSLQAQIAERERAEAEIRRLNAELEIRIEQRTAQLQAVNNELEAFSYSVSHDLRAPLRNISSFSQVLLEDYNAALDATGQELLHDIRGATLRMGQLIENLLALSRVTRTPMQRAIVDLSALGREIAGTLKKAQPERAVEMIIAEDMLTDGDASLLQAVLENLLSNAWKFTQKQSTPRIEFGVLYQDHEAVYFIKDNGAGFNMKYVNRLFAPFQRLHRATDFPGTGVGLATVQRIIIRHGGRAWAEGVIDEGATFYFTLAKGGAVPAIAED